MSDAPRFAAIVLAAGQGTRMRSRLPKVLHPLLGRPMLAYPIDAALKAGAERVVAVIGHGADAVTAMLQQRFDDRIDTALQAEQRGTGHAAGCGATALPDYQGYFLISYGDAPLVSATLLRELVDTTAASGAKLGLVTSRMDNAAGYGRILRNDVGRPVDIREDKDCSDAERSIQEWNPGIYAIEANFFRKAIGQLRDDNAQGELYLTDMVKLAAEKGIVADVQCAPDQLHGVNDRRQLVECERALRRVILDEHARAGVTIRSPETTFIDADVTIEEDVTLEANVHLRGACRIGRDCHIDTGCVLHDVTVGAGTLLLPYTVASESTIGSDARIGPFSHLRTGSELGNEVHMGNFVETKKTRMARGAKANHLAYLGDGIIGKGVNVGAGTIFCNYDGFNKHTTVLEDGAFIGSDSQLVAPVTVGKDAYVGSGTTVTQDVPPDAFAVGRARQVNKPGLAGRMRARLQAQKEAKAKALDDKSGKP